MTDYMKQMLDELLGKNRDAAPGQGIPEKRFDDADVCKFFLVGFCPHDLFVNTKSDLGECPYIHDETLKIAYEAAPNKSKYGYEDNFFRFIKRLHDDVQRKIKKHMDRLELVQPNGEVVDMVKDQMDNKLKALTNKIDEMVEHAERLGAAGKVDDSSKTIEYVEQLRAERQKTQLALQNHVNEARLMEVCAVCGRLQDHYTGRQHIGHAKIAATYEELLRRRQDSGLQTEFEGRSSRERDGGYFREEENSSKDSRSVRSSDRDRDRHSSRDKRRSRSKDRDNRNGNRDRRRSRSRDRERRGERPRFTDHRHRSDRDRHRPDDRNNDSRRRPDRSGRRSRSRSKDRDRKQREKEPKKQEGTSTADASAAATGDEEGEIVEQAKQ